jgi:Lysyl oxidase
MKELPMAKRWAVSMMVVLVLVGMGAFGRPGPVGAATDRLPDLGMAPLTDLRIDTSTIPGRRLLRFTTVIVNVGEGPFETIGSRLDTSIPEMPVRQRIYDDAGGARDVDTPTVMFFAGDGHDHWHVRDAEGYELRRLDNGRRVGTGAKHGFCYYDNTPYRLSLPTAPLGSVYGHCGAAQDLSVTTGLSVGWGDTYPASIALQWIDITGLKSGRYRLTATADPGRWFFETNEANNATWLDLKLTGSGITVLHQGPAA